MNNFQFEVLGSGCRTCRELFELTKIAVAEMGITSSVLYSTDISKIVALGLVSSPVLTIDNKPILVGMLPDKKRLIEIIKKEVDEIQSKEVKSSPTDYSNAGNN